MRKLLLSGLVGLFFLIFSAQAQIPNVTDLAENLSQNITNLADRSSRDFLNRSTNNKNDLENLLTTRQLKVTIETFLLLVSNNRPISELRDTSDALNDLARKFSANSSNNSQWQQIKRDIDELSRQLKETGGSQNNDQNKNRTVLGKIHWQGTIDDEVHLVIKGSAVQIRTISGTEYSDGIFNFTSPLPDESVQVSVNKKEGRGSVKVIQQPNGSNNFTAIIQVLDKNGGAKEYVLEIYWTR